MQEVRYVWLVSRLKNKKELTAEKSRDFEATSKVQLMLLDAKLQTGGF